jgi:hypothetical protein
VSHVYCVKWRTPHKSDHIPCGRSGADFEVKTYSRSTSQAWWYGVPISLPELMEESNFSRYQTRSTKNDSQLPLDFTVYNQILWQKKVREFSFNHKLIPLLPTNIQTMRPAYFISAFCCPESTRYFKSMLVSGRSCVAIWLNDAVVCMLISGY